MSTYNPAQVVFNDTFVRKLIFYFLQDRRILYEQKNIIINQPYYHRVMYPRKFVRIKDEFNIVELIVNCNSDYHELQRLKILRDEQKRKILGPFGSIEKRKGVLSNHQRSKIIGLINQHPIVRAQIIYDKNKNKCLRIFYLVAQFCTFHKCSTYTTRLQ